ncbi:hypothetical protein SARC_11217, partial [Sphaeroforma arctica JP610]
MSLHAFTIAPVNCSPECTADGLVLFFYGTDLPSVTCTYSQTSKYVQAMGSCHPGRHGDVIVSNVCDVEMITKTVRKRPKAGDTRLSLGSLSDDDHPATTPTF